MDEHDEPLQVLLFVEELRGQHFVALSILAEDAESVQLAVVLLAGAVLYVVEELH